jgi:hypothetical protein
MDTRMDRHAHSIVDTTLIPHPTFVRAVARIEQCFQAMDASTDPVCIAIVGESRTGKSRVLEHVEINHPTCRQKSGIVAPFVRIRVPSKPTVKGLCELLLHKLGDPLYEKGTENVKNLRLVRLMTEAKTVILALDEFQHFYDKTTRRVQHHVADWLKVLVDDAQVGLIVTGLPSCLSVIQQNEQLSGRFMAPVRLHRFDWMNDDDRSDFIGILDGMRAALQEFDMPDVASDEMAFRFYCATGGLIGYVSKVLKQAVWNAVDTGRKTITLADLSDAYVEAVIANQQKVLTVLNPFTPDFGAAPNPGLLAAVREIGTPKVEEAPPPRRRKPATPKVGEVLNAA